MLISDEVGGTSASTTSVKNALLVFKLLEIGFDERTPRSLSIMRGARPAAWNRVSLLKEASELASIRVLSITQSRQSKNARLAVKCFCASRVQIWFGSRVLMVEGLRYFALVGLRTVKDHGLQRC